MFRRLMLTLLIVSAIPAIGIGVSYWIQADINSDFTAEGLMSLNEFCALPEASSDADVSAACSEYMPIVWLGQASVATLIVGLAIPGLFLLASVVTGTNRGRMAFVFGPLVRLTLVALSAAILVQGAILTYGVYIGESYAIGRIHPVLIAVIAIGAVVGSFSLITTAFRFSRRLNTSVFGHRIERGQAPELWGIVDDVSEKLGARKPNNIVLGLEPNFFATSADVTLVGQGQKLSGETLFISASLAKMFSTEELTAVIGHELGHFRGADTAYSLKFAPVYAGLNEGLTKMDVGEDEGASAITKLPAIAVLSLLLEIFSNKEAIVSREREHEADKAATEVVSATNIVSALIKAGVAGQTWDSVRKHNAEQLNQGQVYENLSDVASSYANSITAELKTNAELKGLILGYEQSHPTDSHPSLSERAGFLGVELDETFDGVKEASTHRLQDDLSDVERELTILEHQYMIAIGAAQMPEEETS